MYRLWNVCSHLSAQSVTAGMVVRFMIGVHRHLWINKDVLQKKRFFKPTVGLVIKQNLKFYCTEKVAKAKKFLISCEIRNFLVETTGLEPVTFCVWTDWENFFWLFPTLSNADDSSFKTIWPSFAPACPLIPHRTVAVYVVKTASRRIGHPRGSGLLFAVYLWTEN